MAFFNYPFHVTKDTPAIASEVQTNFDQLLAWVLANLIQKDGTVAMTGPLVLAPGDPGAPGHAANKAYVDAQLPVGMMTEFAGTALPAGWLWCNGDTYTNTSQQSLAAAIGRTYTAAAVPTGSFQVPDMRKRSPVGYDATEAAKYGLGVKGGQRDSELLSHAHTTAVGTDSPDHTHSMSFMSQAMDRSIDHLHSGATAGEGGHSHTSNGGHGEYVFRDGAFNTGYHGPPVGYGIPGGVALTWGPTVGGNHAHSFTTGAADRSLDHLHHISGGTYGANARHAHTVTVNPNGAGTTLVDKNLPPYIVVNYIIYAGKS